eukprot:9476459-Pyramimonas_sp.AAC.1
MALADWLFETRQSTRGWVLGNTYFTWPPDITYAGCGQESRRWVSENLSMGWVCEKCTQREVERLQREDPEATAQVQLRVSRPQLKKCDRTYIDDSGTEVLCGEEKSKKLVAEKVSKRRLDDEPLSFAEFRKESKKLYQQVAGFCQKFGTHAVVGLATTANIKSKLNPKKMDTPDSITELKTHHIHDDLHLVSEVFACGKTGKSVCQQWKFNYLWHKTGVEKIVLEASQKSKKVSDIRAFCERHADKGFTPEIAARFEEKHVMTPDYFM